MKGKIDLTVDVKVSCVSLKFMLVEENFGFQHSIKLLFYKNYSEGWIIYGDGEEKYILYTGLFSLICKRFHQFLIRQDSEKKTLFLTNTVILKLILILPVLNLPTHNAVERGVNKTGATISVKCIQYMGMAQFGNQIRNMFSTFGDTLLNNSLCYPLNIYHLSWMCEELLKKEPVDCYL